MGCTTYGISGNLRLPKRKLYLAGRSLRIHERNIVTLGKKKFCSA